MRPTEAYQTLPNGQHSTDAIPSEPEMNGIENGHASAGVEETHHDLTVHAVRSHESSSDDEDDDGRQRGGASGPSIIGRLRPRDAKFQKLEQADDDGHSDDDENDASASSPPRLAQDARRQESDIFDNEGGTAYEDTISPSHSPNRLGSRSASTSFDDYDGLDLDDTDLEYGINRYSVNFSESSSGHQNGRANGKGGKSSNPHLSRQVSTASSLGDRIVAPVMSVVGRVKSARVDARRKRAEQLLAMPDDGLISGRINLTRISVCFSNWCDMSVSDRGVILVAILVAAFVGIYKLLDEEEDKDLRRGFLLIGVPLIVLRFTWRYIWWFVWERRQERRRKVTMQVFDGLNGEHGTGGLEIPAVNNDDEDEFSVASSLMLSVVDNDNDVDDVSLS